MLPTSLEDNSTGGLRVSPIRVLVESPPLLAKTTAFENTSCVGEEKDSRRFVEVKGGISKEMFSTLFDKPSIK